MITDDKLFKFYPFNQYSLQVLINREIWLCPPDKLNDPFEGDFLISDYRKYHNLDFVKKLFRLKTKTIYDKIFYEADLKLAINDFDYFVRILYEYVNTEIMKQYSIASFSNNPYDLQMWSHYADSHRGFCLIFDRNKLNCEALLQTGREIENVIYGSLPTVEIIDKDDNIEINIDDRFMLHKLRNWNKEDEARVLKKEKFDDLSSRTLKFKDSCLHGIIYSSRIDINNIRTLNYLLTTFENKSLKYYYAFKDLIEIGIGIKEIDLKYNKKPAPNN